MARMMSMPRGAKGGMKGGPRQKAKKARLKDYLVCYLKRMRDLW